MDVLTNIRRQPEFLTEVAEYLSGRGGKELRAAMTPAKSARHICFAAMGGSLYAALPASLYLAEYGIYSTVVDAGELLYYETVPADSFVVLVSRSGRTAEVVKLAARLKEKGIRTVAVTNCPDSPLAKTAGAQVHIAGPLDEGISLCTYTAAVLTLLYAAAEIAGNRGLLHAEVTDMLQRLPAFVAACEAQVGQLPLASHSHFYLLGRGYLLSAAREGCLLLQEMARRPATWYNSAEFRQGPVEALSPAHAVFLMAPAGRTESLSQSLAGELARTGATVVVLGAEATGAGATIALPEAPEHLAPLLSIIPLQLAAYLIAAAGNEPVGRFRFAAPTTVCETTLPGAKQ